MMKHFILTFSLLMGVLFLAPSSVSANASAAASTSITEMSPSTTSVKEHKMTFLEKIMAKRMAKKMKKAIGAIGAAGDDAKLVAILAHFLWIIALILHLTSKKTALGGYHLAQNLGNFILFWGLSITFGVFLSFLGPIAVLVSSLIGLAGFVNWLFGLINAFKEEEKPMPILGNVFNDLLGGLFE